MRKFDYDLNKELPLREDGDYIDIIINGRRGALVLYEHRLFIMSDFLQGYDACRDRYGEEIGLSFSWVTNERDFKIFGYPVGTVFSSIENNVDDECGTIINIEAV